VNRNETLQVHCPSEWASWHSVGHLIPYDEAASILMNWVTHRVQVPLARGSVMPEIASMSDDFPALCQPMTAMEGISRSTSAL